MDNKWIVRGSSLCGIDLGCRIRVGSIRAEAVNGLCGENYKSSVLYNLSGVL